ncbi:MAG TPA: hypothetical protein VG935_04875 [Patescibacteria group bacterium]|nr:hypothetical protein [Patescibacteria group bacterium]
MDIVIGYFEFVAAAFFSLYVPGSICLKLLRIHKSRSEDLILKWLLGIAVFLIATYLLSWVGLSQAYLIIVVGCSIYYLSHLRKQAIRSWLQDVDILPLAIIVVGSLGFLGATYFSGYETTKGMEYVGFNGMDGIRHIAYIRNMTQYFPPQKPEMAGVELRGFHYFYDFLLSKFIVFYGMSARDLYFRYFPLLIGLLYGGGFYLFASMLTKEKIKHNLILFFAYFSQSSLFVLVLFNHSLDLINNGAVQPLGLIINPFTVLAVGLLLGGLALLPDIQKSWKYAVLSALILGVISQMKIYAGLCAIGVLGVYALYAVMRSRWNRKIIINFTLGIIITAVITAITYLPNNYKAGGLVWAPLLFYSHYLQSEQFQSLQWELRRQVYAAAHNWPHLIVHYLEAISIFWLVNLGSSLVIVLGIKDLIRKKFWQQDGNIIITTAIVVPVLIGSFFIQTTSPFDTVQFFWIALALIGIPTGMVFGSLYLKSNHVFKIILLLIIIGCSVPGVLDFEKKYLFPEQRRIIPGKYLSVMRSVESIVPMGKFIIYLPIDFPRQQGVLPSDTLIIPARTGRSVYLGDGGVPTKLDTSYATRQQNQDELKSAILDCNVAKIEQVLAKINSPYLLTTNRFACLQHLASKSVISPDGRLAFYVFD